MAVLIRIFLVSFFLCHALAAHAQNLQLEEQEIKAGLLYNFLKYTEWPAGALSESSIKVCVFGDDPFDGRLQPMAGRTVNQREIIVRMLLRTVSDAGGCQLLFVNSDNRGQWSQLRAFLKGKSVLTVSDYAGFAEDGGMIEFGHRNEHISAKLNMDAAVTAGLNIERRMLRLVTVVHPEGEAP